MGYTPLRPWPKPTGKAAAIKATMARHKPKPRGKAAAIKATMARHKPKAEVIAEAPPPTPIPPSGKYPKVAPILSVPELPKGEQSTAYVGGFTITAEGVTPHTLGAEELVKVRIAGERTTFWRKVLGGYIQVNLKGEAIIPQLSPERLKLIAGQLTELSKLEGKAQFEEAVRIGLVPQDATYVKTKEGWGYITKSTRKEYLAAIRETGKAKMELAKQQIALSTAQKALKNYTSAEGTDIARYLRDHPNNEALLLTAGFSNEQINKAKEYNARPFVGKSGLEGWWEKVRGQGGGNLHPLEFQQFLSNNPELAKEGLAIFTGAEKIKAYKKPDISLDQFVAEFMAARNIEPIGVSSVPSTREQYDAREMALHQYASIYGTKELNKSIGQTALTYLFAPARALYPEVELKDIKPLEWGIGAAQIALLVAPFATGPLKGTAIAGKLKPIKIKGVKVKVPTIKGVPAEEAPGLLTQADIAKVIIRGGVGGVFTYATVKNWDNMTPGDRVIAVIIDSIIIGSAAQPIASHYWRGKFRVSTGKVIDTSAKGKMPRTAQVNVELEGALRDLAKAIETRNQVLLLNAAERLKLIGTRNPKLLGSGELVRKAQLLLDNPKQYLALPEGKLKPQSAKTINDALEGNRRFIETAERTLRRVKEPARQKAIEEALTHARTQVQVAEKFRPIIQSMEEYPFGKYLPQVAVTEKALVPVRPKPSPKPKPRPKSTTSVFPGIKYKVKVETATGREVAIPAQAFGTMTMAQIAQRYGVSEDEIVWAVASSPLAQSALQNLSQTQVKTRQKRKEKVAPYPVTKPQAQPQPKEKIATETETTTETETATEEQPAPFPLLIPTVDAPPTTQKPSKPPRLLMPSKVLVKDVKGLPRSPGIVSWRQGIVWISVLPPYLKGERSVLIYSTQPPPLARLRKGRPKETVYTWKGDPPEELTMEMGAFDATVTKGKRIAFARARRRAKATMETPEVMTKIARARKARYRRRVEYPEPEKLLYL